MSLHNKSAGHLKILESNKNTVTPSPSTSFVDCGEANIKLEIKEEEETLYEDPLFIKMEAENADEDIQDKDSDDEYEVTNKIDIVHHKIEM